MYLYIFIYSFSVLALFNCISVGPHFRLLILIFSVHDMWIQYEYLCG
jgi:hypothetical protein